MLVIIVSLLLSQISAYHSSGYLIYNWACFTNILNFAYYTFHQVNNALAFAFFVEKKKNMYCSPCLLSHECGYWNCMGATQISGPKFSRLFWISSHSLSLYFWFSSFKYLFFSSGGSELLSYINVSLRDVSAFANNYWKVW